MTEENKFHAGYVAVVGRPNVGKSTLINTLLDQKIAAVSAKPQTTRRRQLGILTTETSQIIFVDTPGLHVPQHKLGDFMNQEAAESLHDADLVLWLVDASSPISAEDKLIADRLNAIRKRPPVLMTLSKCDLISEDTLLERKKACLELFPANDMVAISSLTKEGLEELKSKILASLPLGEHFYDADTITDYYERDIAGELIREAVLEFVRDEVPHCIAVQVDQFEERGQEGAYIVGTIFVERDSQKGIIIGQKAEMIKKIGMRARQEIEAMSGRKVYLDLHVKVNKSWRNSADALKLLGFAGGKEK
ncbi:MAG: GTPase Era [Chloroflexi bacterium HGW-Chloroflexi-4]|jgi:GTP-binding protein Era|nr:MAG: GTPase Era [Chloroflexi bacterium HGW-Chloroflexi-4]